ncbi:MAG TPA: TetR/AcrR family transcriptional regulator [Candidatus Eisenbacteria bacterium]|jgi:AcrR family transcriptional regulator
MMQSASAAATGEPARITEQSIYNAAVRLIFERGYHGTSLRAVAGEVGLQMSSLYYYFPSKQDLLMQIMRRTMSDLMATVERAIAKAADPEGRLRAAIRAHILFHAKRREEAFVVDAELRALAPANYAAVVATRDRYERLFAEVLRDGAEQGQFRVPDAKLAVFALMAMCTGVAVWYRPHGRLSLERVADIYTDLFLRGVLAGGA